MLAEIYPDSLLEVSIYAFVVTLTAIVFGPFVGGWAVSSQRSRLTTLRTSIVAQKMMIASTAALLWLVHKGVAGKSLFGIAIVSGSILRLASRATTIGVEKDWAVIICQWRNTPQTEMNAALRRVDLFCKLAAPLAVSLIAIPLSVPETMLVVSALALVSIPIELILIERVFWGCGALLSRTNQHESATVSPEINDDPHAAPLNTPPRVSLFSKWALYIRHRMFLSSLSLSLLYFTTLNFGNVMITYLVSLKYTPAFLAVMRSLSVVAGLVATFTAPVMIHRFGLVNNGLISIWSQVACLLPALYSFHIFQNSTSILPTVLFFSGVTLSRVGLWSFDISHMELVQEQVIGEEEMGAFNGCEFSLQSAFELLSYLVTMLWNRPDDFWISASATVGAIVTAAICFSVFATRSGQRIRVEEEVVANERTLLIP
ncbi:hypothetical protein HDU98_004993 [Podochytrium sp. JEL0797]|nr:hypothetical protein HDU98_004993 [Podochytrium sp. JEL0797]